MNSKTHKIDDHVGALLSGYLDGELTQQQRQLVDVHCDTCKECKQTLEELLALRESIGKARLSEVGEDVWREMMDDTTVRASRGIGWLLLIGGAVIALGFVVFNLIFNPAIGFIEKLFIIAIYGGFALLFLSVLRQRLIERKTDKYKDVEI